ncbi:hypothetical protein BOX15_Mlig013623g1 [Macrostomum lignano]|uniref:Trafficking protein particle complex subunit n=3 Tax=Macrostomum lignano TaxID=282301 RepID=A0A1I8GIU3_9PLAT|nr:hypothetical protein BOX15_Mlig013623g1 [Macrostomum lignano]
MPVYNIMIINNAGALVYTYTDQSRLLTSANELEKTYSYPLEPVIEVQDSRCCVVFGEADGVRIGHCVLAVNGTNVQAGRPTLLENGQEVMSVLANPASYPVSIKFGKLKLTANERINLAGMFHSIYAITAKLSPVAGSSGLQLLETDAYRLHCLQTVTGVKILVITDPKQANVNQVLKRIYEIYADYALKNPFFTMQGMNINFTLFEEAVQSMLRHLDKFGNLTNLAP